MEKQIYDLGSNIYASFHDLALGQENLLQLQTVVPNVRGQPSVKVQFKKEDFYFTFSDWKRVRDIVDESIENFHEMDRNYSHIFVVDFTCPANIVDHLHLITFIHFRYICFLKALT